MTTTGLNTAARVKITSSAPTLILSATNTGQLLTYQITASVTDVAGNVLASQPQLYYDILAGHGSATVSDSGLVTGEAEGNVVVQVACTPFGQNVTQFTPSGLPINAITAEQSIQVTTGFIVPDFYFVLTSPSAGNYVITQHPETNSTWDDTVTYTLGPTNANPSVLGTITGSGTLSFSNSSQNFVVQATCAASGTNHWAWSTWNSGNLVNPVFAYPVLSSRGRNDGASGTSNSGTPYVA